MGVDVPGSRGVGAGRDRLERGCCPGSTSSAAASGRVWRSIGWSSGGSIAGDAVLLEPPRLHEHLALEGADRLVVGLHRAVERLPELARRARPSSRGACRARARGPRPRGRSPPRVSCCQVIATVRRRIIKRARRGEDDVRAPGVLLERRVVLVRRAEVRLVGQEHDDEVGRRLELTPVRLRRELVTCSRT